VGISYFEFRKLPVRLRKKFSDICNQYDEQVQETIDTAKGTGKGRSIKNYTVPYKPKKLY